MAPAKMAVHQDAGADLRALVDMRVQTRMRGQFAGMVMVEVIDPDTRGKQAKQAVAVLRERDVERGDRIAGYGIDAIKQVDIALDAGHERGVAGMGQAQLLQGTQAVASPLKAK